jgi:hypothetical protein
MSRVPTSPQRDELVAFRATPAEKAEWQAEADRQGVSLSELLRHAANEYCQRRKKPKKAT